MSIKASLSSPSRLLGFVKRFNLLFVLVIFFGSPQPVEGVEAGRPLWLLGLPLFCFWPGRLGARACFVGVGGNSISIPD